MMKMKKNNQPKTITLASVEALDATVGEIVRKKIEHTQTVAEMEARIAAIQKEYAPRTGAMLDYINALEACVLEYCTAHRDALFTEKKSRETTSAVIGFELTPHRVETNSRKLKIGDVLTRLKRLGGWAKAYIRQPDVQLDKAALLVDREKLTPEQLHAAGLQFVQDEQFYIRPKSEVAEDSTQEAKAA